jgi:TonB family protein
MITRKRSFIVLTVLGVLTAGKARAVDEPAVQGEGKTLTYLSTLHAKVHRAWADNFLAMADARLPKDHPVNLPTRAVTVNVVLTATGALQSAEVGGFSGSSEFDTSALEVVRINAPYVPAPDEVLSDDGHVHLEWTFARDHRRCSGLRVKQVQSPLPEAMRSMVSQGREAVALARLRAATDEERVSGMSAFAQAWIDGASEGQPVPVAVARALSGDAQNADKLRQAVEQGRDVEKAAAGLAHLGLPICPLVKAKLEGPAGPGRVQALSAVRVKLEAECLSGTLAVAKDRSAPEAERVAAVQALGAVDDSEAQKTLQALAKEGSALLRGTAVLASVRPGAGRGVVFRVTPLLNDPSPEVRGAASAALLRAGGESTIPQLFKLFREKDPRPGELAAKELAAMKGEASAEFLGKLARGKEPRRVRVACASALASRRDEHAAKFLSALASDPDPELRFLASGGLDAEKRLAAASAAETQGWQDSYRALVQGAGRLAALDWALVQFPKLESGARVEALAPWLVQVKPAEVNPASK